MFVVTLIVPTGVGASIGGFGGDATQAAHQLAAVCDVLVTHPNVLNAAVFLNKPANAWYVEGYALDAWLKGHCCLQPVRQANQIGVVFDAGIEPAMLCLHQNVLNAMRTVYGLTILEPVITSEPLQLSCGFDPSGASSGNCQNPGVLKAACQQLVDNGAQALAIAAQMPEIEGDALYQQGQGVDPIGGIEAILSHWVVSQFQRPAAHAPVFRQEDAEPAFDRLVDPRAAAEFIAPTFLPCVLLGLSQAPQLRFSEASQAIDTQEIHTIVLPSNALGGVAVWAACQRNIPLILVQNNKTVLSMDLNALTQTATAMGLRLPPVYPVATYAEAAALITRLKTSCLQT